MLTDDQSRAFIEAARDYLRTKSFAPDIDREDLISEAIIRALRGPDYDPERSAVATFARRYVDRAISDMATKRDRRLGCRAPESVFGRSDALSFQAFRRTMRMCAEPEDSSGLSLDEALPKLTPQEVATLQAFTGLATASEVGLAMGLSKRTIDFHLSNAYGKLGVKSLHLALIATRDLGYIAL